MEEYQETYRSHIQILEENIAQMFYAQEAKNENESSPTRNIKYSQNPYIMQMERATIDDHQAAFLSPLNFSKLAIGAQISKETCDKEEEKLEQQSIVVLDAVISSNSKRDQVQRESLFSYSKSG